MTVIRFRVSFAGRVRPAGQRRWHPARMFVTGVFFGDDGLQTKKIRFSDNPHKAQTFSRAFAETLVNDLRDRYRYQEISVEEVTVDA